MKKLLYIAVNSKPEELSTSKTVGREFVTRFLKRNTDYELLELDIYNVDIPELKYQHFKSRAELVTGQDYDSLSEEDKKIVDRIDELCNQFLSADTYVIAAPMWSVTFPSRLKRYIDCVILNNRVIKINDDKVQGLLDDKERNMIYIQSSGGVYPKILGSSINHGVHYLQSVFKFLGMKRFYSILVEGVDMASVGKDKAIEKAFSEMDDVIAKLS